jgi:Sulfotransferase family
MSKPKRLLGSVVASLTPQCSFDRAIFVIGHMRCGSTALSNILCSRPDISGYGEAHIAYTSEADLGVLALNQRRRGAWKSEATYIFDKILHSRYDGDPPAAFFSARAIFVARAPGPAIASIRNLFGKIGSEEYQQSGDAEAYYAERLTAMMRLWNRFPPENRIGLSYENLVEDPDAILERISRHLRIGPPLANRYSASLAARGHGAGDPLVAGKQASIIKLENTVAAMDKNLTIISHEISSIHDRFSQICSVA